MARFKPEFENMQVNIRTAGQGLVKLDTSTADPNQWAKVKEFAFMIEGTAIEPTQEQAPAVDYNAMTLAQLRTMFPDIKAISKAQFIAQIG